MKHTNQVKTYYLSDLELAERYSVSRSTIWRWVSQGDFPSPVKLSPGCSRWPLSSIEAYEAEKTASLSTPA